MESIASLKKSSLMLPVSRVKDLSPLGHSGQDRLHAVVGSIEIESGRPYRIGLPNNLLR
jgi:hypothetical protein